MAFGRSRVGCCITELAGRSLCSCVFNLHYISFIVKFCFPFSEETQGKCDGDNRANNDGRRRRFNAASGVTCEMEQVYLPLPSSCHIHSRTSPSGRSQRMAVCSGAETAGFLNGEDKCSGSDEEVWGCKHI